MKKLRIDGLYRRQITIAGTTASAAAISPATAMNTIDDVGTMSHPPYLVTVTVAVPSPMASTVTV